MSFEYHMKRGPVFSLNGSKKKKKNQCALWCVLFGDMWHNFFFFNLILILVCILLINYLVCIVISTELMD